MKAIQIKFLGCTDTLPSRLKAWSEGGLQKVESLDYDLEVHEQAKRLARRYAIECWSLELSGFGTLPNGDFVGVVG